MTNLAKETAYPAIRSMSPTTLTDSLADSPTKQKNTLKFGAFSAISTSVIANKRKEVAIFFPFSLRCSPQKKLSRNHSAHGSGTKRFTRVFDVAHMSNKHGDLITVKSREVSADRSRVEL